MFNQTGRITNVVVLPAAFNDATAPDGVRVEDQINLTLKGSSDEREYQHSLPVNDKVVALKQLEEWQGEGKLVTVFASGVRAIPFAHDTRRDEQGNPLKKYMRSGRKTTLADSGVAVELDAMIVFQSYDVKLAEAIGLDKEAERAAGNFLKNQQQYRQRSNQVKIERARQQVEDRKARMREELAAKQAQATQTAAPATGGRKSA